MDRYLDANIVFSKFAKGYMALKKDLPIRHSEMGVLNIIVQHDRAFTPLTIAEFLGVSKPMVTTHITSLEKKGYIYREHSSEDKRSFFVMPTEKAKRLVNETAVKMSGYLKRLEESLGQDRFTVFVETLSDANEIFKEVREEMKNEELTFYPAHPSGMKTHKIETSAMPVLSQNAPLDAKTLCTEFQNDLDSSLAIYEDKRFEVTGIAIKIGPDVHNKPSIEISDEVDGQCYALCIFPADDFYEKVSTGDTVTVRANYLVMSNWFGVVMKYSELVGVAKP